MRGLATPADERPSSNRQKPLIRPCRGAFSRKGRRKTHAYLHAPIPVISRPSPSAIPFRLAMVRAHATLSSFRRMEGS